MKTAASALGVIFTMLGLTALTGTYDPEPDVPIGWIAICVLAFGIALVWYGTRPQKPTM